MTIGVGATAVWRRLISRVARTARSLSRARAHTFSTTACAIGGRDASSAPIDGPDERPAVRPDVADESPPDRRPVSKISPHRRRTVDFRREFEYKFKYK